ncbi:hypothetical protein F2Q70_00013091 [Brassica cretica]|uniref:Uncharacterized protein n=1 Tax=Brassica cretica TaxID=69181 RepID=A0A8S9M4T6_BRACR|nr:hypothetical protein F2Q70_00013091 [Brassica cretica]
MRPERGAHHKGNCTPERKIDLTGVAEPSRNAGMALDRNDRDDLKKTSARDWEKNTMNHIKKEKPLKDCPLNLSWDNLLKLRSGPSRTTSTSELNSAQPKLPNSSSKLARRKGQHHHSKTLLLPLEAK